MVNRLLDRVERNRKAALAKLDPQVQGALGQHFTPIRAASMAASMPRLSVHDNLRVLDPGAGSGVLSAALVDRVLAEQPNLAVHLVAVELDSSLLPSLIDTLEACAAAGEGRVSYEIVSGDYIVESTRLGREPMLNSFDLVIQNPPYAKLGAASSAREMTRKLGADVPNLYAAFLTLSAAALAPGGQLVAITPRSFCNGPYFGAFRGHFLAEISLDRVHVFQSRSRVFADAGVLQENVIISGTKGGTKDQVILSASDDHEGECKARSVQYQEVVHPEDPHQFIRVTTNGEDTEIAGWMLSLPLRSTS